MDIRSLRYPGLISHTAKAGGGTTDYGVDIFHQAISERKYSCFLKANSSLPMMYMPDAVRATLELMDAPLDKVRKVTSYNLAAMSFTRQNWRRRSKLICPIFKSAMSLTTHLKNFPDTITEKERDFLQVHLPKHKITPKGKL